jgi:hypothetical protein
MFTVLFHENECEISGAFIYGRTNMQIEYVVFENTCHFSVNLLFSAGPEAWARIFAAFYQKRNPNCNREQTKKFYTG